MDTVWEELIMLVPLPGHLLMVGLSELQERLLEVTDQDLGFPPSQQVCEDTQLHVGRLRPP